MIPTVWRLQHVWMRSIVVTFSLALPTPWQPRSTGELSSKRPETSYYGGFHLSMLHMFLVVLRETAGSHQSSFNSSLNRPSCIWAPFCTFRDTLPCYWTRYTFSISGSLLHQYILSIRFSIYNSKKIYVKEKSFCNTRKEYIIEIKIKNQIKN